MADIRVTFVLPNDANDESDASQNMVQAYDSCKQLINNISWMKDADLAAIKFTKLDYLVFENFEGRDFSKFIDNKCAVVGPLAISVCLMEGKSIPSFQWPILNVALYGCEVTCSQLTKSEKEAIKNKVQLMGGFYTGNFIDSVTHLICDGTKSEKYMLAAGKGAKLMLPAWIDHLFEVSQLNNVNANDPKILGKFRCPPLHKLTICSTGITSNKERAKLADIISANGGTMVQKLNLSKTDVLLCQPPSGTTSDKFKAARNAEQISCVTVNWIFDSIQKGYALPPEEYRVKTVTSTPTKEGENIDPNFSTISAIGGLLTLRKSYVNETVHANQTSVVDGPSSAVKRSSNKRKADDDLVENIDIKKVKNAGNFLDGCSVFVAGFSPTRRDKLNKIINISGATRYDDFSERVSHVIVGDPACSEVTAIKAKGAVCCLVSVKWLLDSVEQQKPADEDQYLITNMQTNEDIGKTTTSSPLSKKVMNFLREDNILTDNNKDVIKSVVTTAENDDPLTQRYLKNASKDKEEEDTLARLLGNQDNPDSLKPDDKVDEFTLRTRRLISKNNLQDSNQTMEFRPHDTSTQISPVTTDISDESDVLTIFNSYKFILDGFDEQTRDTYREYIASTGGVIPDKDFKGVCDYAVLPVVSKPAKLPPVQEIVNEIWLNQCIENRCLYTDIQYYHRPIELASTCPLQACVITISGYLCEERAFLKSVIEGLGGIFQEQFSRRINEVRKVQASTHLISPAASGKKYEAALKWNLPVTTKDWLLECAKTGKKVSLKNFVIGESKNPDSSDDTNDAESLLSNENHEIREDPSTTLEQQKNEDGPGEMTGVAAESREEIQSVATSTPTGPKRTENDVKKTPLNQIYNFNQKNTPEICSQVTPINKILQEAINSKVLPTPPSPKTYYPWDPKTPDTPLGAFIRPNPSPRLRKEMQKYVNSFPEFVPPKKRNSTPLSELKKRLMDKVLGRGEYSQSTQNGAGSSSQEVKDGDLQDRKHSDADLSFDINELRKCTADKQSPNIENIEVHQKLQELHQRVMASGSSSATRRSSRMFEASSNLPGIEKTNVDIQSQICTVGWDYGEDKTQKPQQKLFMLSGVEPSYREQLANDLKTLGALVSETHNYDPSSTHLLCPKPGRNEKTLACMAAGKWILHISYVEKSVAAGHFLDEEEYEFGNPKAKNTLSYEEKDNSIYFWRKEITRRGYGAFNDMRAIIIAEKKEPITNVLEAGGGVVVNVTPPFDDSIHATHCLLELKMLKDLSKYVVLAEQGIKCVNTIYINDFLWGTKKDDVDYIIPAFSQYYK